MHNTPEDIQQTLDQLYHAPSATPAQNTEQKTAEALTVTSSKPIQKLGANLQQHPWIAVLCLGTAFACGQLVCPYFGITLAGVWALWAVSR